jgi:chaperonin GroEL
MSKMMQFNEEALKSILKGVTTLSKAVKATLGPRGRNVILNEGREVISTKDGVTVAKGVHLKDKFENMGAQLVKEASSKTADIAGDGTTTAIVLTETIFQEGVKSVMAGSNPMSIKKGLDIGAKVVLDQISSLSTPVASHLAIEQIATISANNDPVIGKMIASAMEEVGLDGVITVDEAKGIDTYLKVVKGMEFDKGYLSPYFITHPEKMTVEFEEAHLVVTDQKISTAKEIAPLLEKVFAKGKKPLLIIAEEIEGEALSTLVINKLKGGLPIAAVKAPAFGERRTAILEDIATLTGATFITKEFEDHLDHFELKDLGEAKRIVIGKESTTLVGGKGDKEAIEKRSNAIRAQMQRENITDYDRKNLEERLAKITGGVAVIYVGAPTEGEMKEKKYRIEDALHATKEATREGVVVGGGVSFIRSMKALDQVQVNDSDEKIGVSIVKKALLSPITSIANNCGVQGDVIAQKIIESEGNIGFNGATGQIEDLVKAGVIDPTSVPKTALKNAISIGGLLVTVSCMVTEKPKKGGKKNPPPLPGMGGMPGMGGIPGMM